MYEQFPSRWGNKERADLFPALTATAIEATSYEVDPRITTRHIFKGITPYLKTMVEVTGVVVEIQEDTTDFGALTQIHIMDENGNSVFGIYNNTTDGILDQDVVTHNDWSTNSLLFV
ncbi:hypothetical protein [Paenibacillus lactis]|uniref:hypothetical protein n=1 Tax=Paenibacillus lactis TaxID=228574 RepID=UPI00369B4F6C